MLYQFYESAHAAVKPLRIFSSMQRALIDNPLNPMSDVSFVKAYLASLQVFERTTRQYAKPRWSTSDISPPGQKVKMAKVLQLDFCDLLEFTSRPGGNRPKILLVAPLSGHYATLLTGTVKSLVEDFDVYLTDWKDARDIPLYKGSFNFSSYVDYLIRFMNLLGPNHHLIAVCQPGPAALVATAYIAQLKRNYCPSSLILMGCPIDTRLSPTEPNRLAKSKSLDWFESNVIVHVPYPRLGYLRRVYPGFLQLTGFMTMNLDRHMLAHKELFTDLVKGDGDSVQSHLAFYDEYLAVMDLPAEYYLETLDIVFQQHLIADGRFTYRGEKIDLGSITSTALMTVEGEKDDISGIGQTQAAHRLCKNIPNDRRADHVQKGVGHYGVFNGSRWRAEIAPRVRDFIKTHSN